MTQSRRVRYMLFLKSMHRMELQTLCCRWRFYYFFKHRSVVTNSKHVPEDAVQMMSKFILRSNNSVMIKCNSVKVILLCTVL